MNIENMPFSNAFQRLYLHRYKDPALKLFELLYGKERTILQVTYDITARTIDDVTAYMWAPKAGCLVRCSVMPCYNKDGGVDIWTITHNETIDEGTNDNRELKKILKPEFFKIWHSPHQMISGPGWDSYQDRFYLVEDHGNYDGWIQCLFAEKYLESHPGYRLRSYQLWDE